ncbi:hypothetical protein B0H14DRAFT_3874818 [Mycena olivaceomarginata]|nr:hypothetical protein B0H14DRAFT_3874818 [Mycena olivaceomarginata]
MMILLLKNNPAFTFLFVLQGRVYALSCWAFPLVQWQKRPPASASARPSATRFSTFRIPRSSVARVSRSATDETPGISLPCPPYARTTARSRSTLMIFPLHLHMERPIPMRARVLLPIYRSC